MNWGALVKIVPIVSLAGIAITGLITGNINEAQVGVISAIIGGIAGYELGRRKT